MKSLLSGASLALVMLAPPLAAQPAYTSNVPSLQITHLQTLPARESPATAEYCGDLQAETSAAAHVAAQGWAPTAEAELGPLTLVSFVGQQVQALSGTCELLEGNVGIFYGDELLGLIYGTDASLPQIGTITRFDENTIRIWDGDLLPQPVADLHLAEGGALTLQPPAREQSYCDGTATIPLLYNQQISKARQLLMANGWQPVATTNQVDSFAQTLAAAGIPEVDSCAGTGFGFCAFNYQTQGATAFVVTAGEGSEGGTPIVVRYGVTCTN
ncbi:conserved hypothetical protein (plasmid) [Ketogulonicigenium vulgare Y25]|uniref:Putative exported protein n=1 Tax=Ketogulonicigenium vulgare (strain WSH-001) TaxID=759362 RepID=F9YBT1_KETVW|nr:hypothetical protein [Ketogulonicigenium vulgare]ADO44399.1 conserved hypothetical protein [Ketogulonicigenium vulgare Y25]AEM42833.1 putative exported protein [Ketogulonicigenium vulgare WSH-001]ALJ82738.1 hypothetical protein KVH_15595 [Ketogulonicigenium vulgare]